MFSLITYAVTSTFKIRTVFVLACSLLRRNCEVFKYLFPILTPQVPPHIVSAMKRTASDRITRMTSRISEFNPQVTLFQPAEPEESPRRSKRTRTEFKTESIADLEDLKLSSDVPGSSRKHEVYAVPSDASSTLQKREVHAPKKVKAIRQVLDHPHSAPPNWRETYETIKRMRSRFVAPVDTMGCQQAQVKESDPKVPE
jgi:endonuclease-3